MNYKTADPREYFTKTVWLLSALAPEDRRLTPREAQFLIECCVLQYEGTDITKFSVIRDYFVKSGMHPRATDVSQYKNRLAAKGWIKSGHNLFALPKMLIKTEDGSIHTAIEVSFNPNNPGDRQATTAGQSS